MEIVRAAYPKESMPAFRPEYPAQFEEGIKGSAQARRIENRAPGFTRRFSREAIVLTRAMIAARLPELHARVAEIYVAELSLAELQVLRDFYQSAAGRSLTRGIAANTDVVAATKAASSQEGMTKESIDQNLAEAGKRAVQGLGAAETDQLKAFLQTPLGRKIASLEADQISPILRDWSSNPPPEDARRLDAIAQRILTEMLRK